MNTQIKKLNSSLEALMKKGNATLAELDGEVRRWILYDLSDASQLRKTLRSAD